MIEPAFKAGYAAIVGRPNVGKSTLLNNLLDFKVAAVTQKAQTTRHQIRGILNGEHYQVIFLDTPGLMKPKYRLQEAMVHAARRSLTDADLVLFLVEAHSRPLDSDLEILDEILNLNRKVIVIVNKVDAVAKNQVLPLIEHYAAYEKISTIIPISALKSDGLDILENEIVALLPEGQPLYPPDQLTDHPQRFIVSEIIREKIFQRFGDEIPYAATVTIEEFKERGDRKDFIRAVIYVEKASQKGILIGRHGASLKKVGQLARQDIESLLDRKVFLELWVKVKEKWRKDEKVLKEFGYL
ncbi:MAG: GTPase Era [bacterium]